MSVAGGITLDVRAAAHDKASKVLQQVGKQLEATKKKLIAGGAAQTDFGRKAAIATQHMGGFGRNLAAVADKAGVVVQRLGGLRAGMAALGAALAVRKIADLGEKGAVLEAQLARLGKTAGQAQARLRALQDASDGVFSIAALAKFEIKQKEMGVTLGFTGDELAKLDARFTALGVDGGAALEQLVEGIATGRTAALKKIAVVGDLKRAWDDYAKSIGKSTAELTRAEKAAVVVRDVREQLAGVDLEAGTTVTAFEQMSASLADMGTAFQQMLAPLGQVLAPLAGMLADLARMLGAVLTPIVSSLSFAFGPLLEAIALATHGIVRMIELALVPVVRAMAAISGDALAKSLTSTADGMDAFGTATEGATDEIDEQTAALARLRDEQERVATLAKSLSDDRVLLSTLRVTQLEGEARLIERLAKSNGGLTDSHTAQLAALKAQIAGEKEGARVRSLHEKLLARLTVRQVEYAAAIKVEEDRLWDLDGARIKNAGTIAATKARIDELARSLAALAKEEQTLRHTGPLLVADAKALAGAIKEINKPRPRGRGGATRKQRIQFAQQELEILRTSDEVTRARLQHELEMAELIAGHRGSGKGKDERAAEIALQRAQGQRDLLEAIQGSAEASADGLRAEIEARSNEEKRVEAQRSRLRMIDLEADLLDAGTESQRELLRLEFDRAEAARRLAEVSTLDDELAKAVARNDLALATERLTKKTRELNAEQSELASGLSRVDDQFGRITGLMQGFSPEIAAVTGAIQQATQAWAKLAATQNATAQDTAVAINATLGAVGNATAAFVDDVQVRAVIMALFEAAQAAASFASKDYVGAAAHVVAAGLFTAIAGGAGKGSSSPRASAGSTGPSSAPVGGTGGGGGGGSGTQTVIVQFGDGIVLGSPQDVGRAVQEATAAMRGTGSKAAA